MDSGHNPQQDAPYTETDARRDLAAAYRMIARLGLDDVIYTHISARVPEQPDHFLLNPYGLWFHEITPAALVKVDADGSIVADDSGRGINPAGFTIHSAIHAARPEVGCVLHTHTVAGVAVSSQEDGLLPLNQWALQFYNRIGYHDYEGIALDLDERTRLVADLGNHAVLILRNHGLLTVGRDVAEAFKLMVNLNRACEAQLAAQAGGSALRLPTTAVCEKTAAQYRWYQDSRADNPTQRDIEWEAYLRLLAADDLAFHS